MNKLSYKKKEDIAQEASRFLSKFGKTTIPVDVEFIAEKFGLRIVPTFVRNNAFKGCLLLKKMEINIKRAFFESGKENIYRFTVAHELAHYAMHQSIYAYFRGTTVEEWIEFYLENAGTIDRAERQADIFASFLLMPFPTLEEDVEIRKKALARYSPDIRNDRIEQEIARRYIVSLKTAQIRLDGLL